MTDFQEVKNQFGDWEQKSDKFSLDWENFDNPNRQSTSKSQLSVSDIFNESKNSHKDKKAGQEEEIKRYSDLTISRKMENSRNLNDISEIAEFQPNYANQSFRFEKTDTRQIPPYNQRYQKMQLLLSQAKKNSLDAFYKELEAQKQYTQHIEFNNRQQFREYAQTIKQQKRRRQQIIAEQQKLRNKQRQNNGNQTQKNVISMFGVPANFKKKEVFDSLLPDQYADENFFDYQAPVIDQDNNPTQKFDNFYQGQVLSGLNAAQEFFNPNSPPQKKSKQSKKSDTGLQPIREQKHVIFEKTEQDEKLNKLLLNFRNMKNNYDEMMNQLKSNNEEQVKLAEEVYKLKLEKQEKESQKLSQKAQNRSQKRENKVHENIANSEKINEIQSQVSKINKGNLNDMFYLKINEKIQNLQGLVRQALGEIKQEKDQRIVPRSVNPALMASQQNPVQQSQKIEKILSSQQLKYEGSQKIIIEPPESKNSDHLNLSKQQLFPSGNSKGHLELQKFTFQKNSSSKLIYPNSEDQIQNQRKDSQSKANFRSGQDYQSKNSQKNIKNSMKNSNYCSPLQICLSDKNDDYINPEEISSQNYLKVPPFAKQYIPKPMGYQNRNLKYSLMNKSSVISQSFDLHVSAKFTKLQDFLHPIVATIRVGNKCTFSLYDVHTIVYGPQGPGVHTDPSTIFEQQLPKNGHYTFNVYVNKICLDNNGFNFQISYKTDSTSKKKVNLKVPLPLLYFIEPQFIYEEQFQLNWAVLTNQMFIRPRYLDFQSLRTHDDLRLILPFIDIPNQDPNILVYGLVFRYPKTQNLFMLKVHCYTNGEASMHLRSHKPGQNKIKSQILNVLSFILFNPS